MHHLGERGMRPPIGEGEPVDAKLLVVWVGVRPEVAAVSIAAGAVRQHLSEALVAPVPDKSTLHAQGGGVHK